MDLAVTSNDPLSRGEARTPAESSDWVVFGGHEYASPAEMPVDVRIMYDRMLSAPPAKPGAVAAVGKGNASAARPLHADLRALQAEVLASLAPGRASGNSVVYIAGAVTVVLYAVWFLA